MGDEHDSRTGETTVESTEENRATEPSEENQTNEMAGTDSSEDEAEIPERVIDELERVTHRAREAIDESEAAAYREARADLLADHDFTARVRDEDEMLVLYPEEWVEDGTVQMDRIEDIDRGIERPLGSGGEAENWEEVFEHNQEVADAVEAEHGTVHGANAQAFAEFMSNHRARAVENATEEELKEFLSEYYPRNAWPTDDQEAVVEESVQLVFNYAGEPAP